MVRGNGCHNHSTDFGNYRSYVIRVRLNGVPDLRLRLRYAVISDKRPVAADKPETLVPWPEVSRRRRERVRLKDNADELIRLARLDTRDTYTKARELIRLHKEEVDEIVIASEARQLARQRNP